MLLQIGPLSSSVCQEKRLALFSRMRSDLFDSRMRTSSSVATIKFSFTKIAARALEGRELRTRPFMAKKAHLTMRMDIGSFRNFLLVFNLSLQGFPHRSVLVYLSFRRF